MPNLPLIPGSLADPICWTTPQALYNEMFQRGVAVQGTTLTGVIYQDTEPNAVDRDKVWVRTSAGAPVFPPVWTYFSGLGLWLAKHPIPAGTLWAFPYTGLVTSIPTLDGGANVAVTDLTGPFWEAVATLAARVPIGAGTLPSGLVLGVGDTGGEENHALTVPELAPHKHGLTTLGKADATGTNSNNANGLVGYDIGTAGALPDVTDSTGGDINDNVVPHNCLPPYTALTFLRRTARVYLTQPIA